MSDGGSRRVESDGGACRPIALPEFKEPNHRLLGFSDFSSRRQSPCALGLPRPVSVPGASPRMRRLCRYTMCTRLPQPDEASPCRTRCAAFGRSLGGASLLARQPLLREAAPDSRFPVSSGVSRPLGLRIVGVCAGGRVSEACVVRRVSARSST